GIKGFNKRGIYRMSQFYETDKDAALMAAGLPQLNNHTVKPDKIVTPGVTQTKKTKKSIASPPVSQIAP
ncbi:MAG: hypothetical protein ACHQVK_01500, partial [Candidatus Paceibacterales bacterium]